MLCWYGANVELDVYLRGALVKRIDLHPFITIEIEGYPSITFDDSLSAKLFGNELANQTRVSVAWDQFGTTCTSASTP